METKQSFKPLINKNSKLLILGSMPGEDSLKFQEYYGHSRNQFWRIMSAITNKNLLTDYETKKLLLLDSHIALWDVIANCERSGSLDINIKNETPNNIPDILMKYTKIDAIAFNGQKAASSFKKAFGFELLRS
ncbi:MAG: DNA-deoxyinosine glycosylase, partial [Spirochaetales bacterium]|nr:DNA-deoxyinosine glycosylase [Spirochaetales bacterium]